MSFFIYYNTNKCSSFSSSSLSALICTFLNESLSSSLSLLWDGAISTFLFFCQGHQLTTLCVHLGGTSGLPNSTLALLFFQWHLQLRFFMDPQMPKIALSNSTFSNSQVFAEKKKSGIGEGWENELVEDLTLKNICRSSWRMWLRFSKATQLATRCEMSYVWVSCLLSGSGNFYENFHNSIIQYGE